MDLSRRTLLKAAAGTLLPVEWVGEAAHFDRALVGAARFETALAEAAGAVIDRFGVPAIGLCAVRDGKISTALAGVLKAGEPARVERGAHWQLGSLTKTFTATLVAVMVEQKRLAWTSTLGDLFPEWRAEMAAGVADIEIRQIVTHRSGMGEDVVPWEGNDEINAPGLTMPERRSRFIRLAVKTPLLFKPGSRYRYSNQGYNTLGKVVEKVSGLSWEDAIEKWITGPLRIRPLFGEAATYAPTTEPWPHENLGDVTKPHETAADRFRPVAPVPLTSFGYYACNPAGGISLTLEDVGRWMNAHVDGEDRDGIVSAETFRYLHAPYEQGGLQAFVPGREWPVTGPVILFYGSNGRNSATVALYPEHRAGLFFATNCLPADNRAMDGLCYDALLAQAFPRKWPRPALRPTHPSFGGPLSSVGEIAGTSLCVRSLTGGAVVMENWPVLAREFQIWWYGAKDGTRLVLSLRSPGKGRFRLSGRFGHGRNYGGVALQIADLQRDLGFSQAEFGWSELDVGDCRLEDGEVTLTFIARGDAGIGGRTGHLGIDWLRFRAV